MSRIEKLVNAQTKRPDPDKVVSRHQYQRDPQSGSGNCWCGRHEGHRMHRWSDPRDVFVPCLSCEESRHDDCERECPDGRVCTCWTCFRRWTD